MEASVTTLQLNTEEVSWGSESTTVFELNHIIACSPGVKWPKKRMAFVHKHTWTVTHEKWPWAPKHIEVPTRSAGPGTGNGSKRKLNLLNYAGLDLRTKGLSPSITEIFLS